MYYLKGDKITKAFSRVISTPRSYGSPGLRSKFFPYCTSSTNSANDVDEVILSHTVYEPPGEEKGPPLLITHGLLGSKQNWNSIAKATARATHRKVITFDARNHGDSPHTSDFNYLLMADDILHLSKHLGIEQFSLMGHSMGGRTVMTFALKYPEMIEKLVVVDVSPIELNTDYSTMKVYVYTLREIQAKTEGVKQPLSEIRKITDAALKPVVIDPAVRAFLITNLASKDGEIYWKPNLKLLADKFDEIGNFPQELLKKTFDKPTLFIRGQKSLYIPLGDFPKIQKIFTRSHLTTVQNAGHWPHAENTIRFMERLLPFIDGTVCND